MRIVWHGREGSDWFEVYATNQGKDVMKIFEGHPEDFWFEFPYYAKEHGLMDVTEEVKPR